MSKLLKTIFKCSANTKNKNASVAEAELQQKIDQLLKELQRLEANSLKCMRKPKPAPQGYVSGQHDAYYTALNTAKNILL